MSFGREFRILFLRMRSLFRRRRMEQELDEEIDYHVERQVQEGVSRGMTPEAARRAALRAMNGVERWKEECRDMRRIHFVDDFIQDVRYGFRSLRTAPRFTVIAVLTIVLGVGANVTIFSALNPFLFKPLPYPEPDRIVNLYRTSPQSQSWPHAVANFLDYRERNAVFEELAAVMWQDASFAEPGEGAERVFGMRATPSFFTVLSVEPMLGRVFTDADDRPGAERVVVLSHRFWKDRFGSDAGILGRQLRLDRENATVIGVMPEDFEYPIFWGSIDIWRPHAFTPQQRQNRGNNFLRVYGRLKPGVTIEQADSRMKILAGQVLAGNPQLRQDESVRVDGLHVANDLTRKISAFAFAVTFLVLLIACVNLANLQLGRTVARAREFAVRGALGGARNRLLRQSLTESLLLSFAGGALAIPVSFWATQLIARRQFSEMAGVTVTLDTTSLAFALLCTVLTGVVFGAVPAFLASRADINDVLKQSPRNVTSNRSHHRFRYALIVAEVAFTLIILSGAASLIRGLQRIAGVDPGWRADGLLVARLNLTGPTYAMPRTRFEFLTALRDRVASEPGVSNVALAASTVPAVPFNSSATLITDGGSEPFVAYWEIVTPEYFATIGIGLQQGRNFGSDDRIGRPPVVIINETMAGRLWPNESAIGKRIGYTGPNPNWKEVIGVVKDVTFPSYTASYGIDSEFQTYHPMAQGVPLSVSMVLRAPGRPEAIAPELRRLVSELDRDLPVYDVRTGRSVDERNTSGLRLLGGVLGSFAILGLGLAAVGIFGVVSYSMTQRSGEIGIRMALGAKQSEVLWLVIKQGIGFTILGALAGLLGGLALGRVLSKAVSWLPAFDAAVLLGTTLGMIAVALAACYLPARRASKIDPMVALRHD